MQTIKPPEALPEELYGAVPPFSIFLAGTIEMGTAERWQEQVESSLAEASGLILNPRRDAWDASWQQRFEHAQFREQVEWELEGLERASVIAMYLSPTSKSPVSMLEFGLHARSGRMVVCVPDGFWRRGNIEVTARRYGVPMIGSLDALIDHLRGLLA